MTSQSPGADRRKLPLRHLVVAVVEILLVVFVVRYLLQHRAELEQLWSLRSSAVLLFGVLLAAEMLVRGVEFQFAVRLLNTRITGAESLSLSFATSLLNYAPMNAGTVLRARVLKRARDLSYTHYVALMSALILLSIIAGACLGILVLALGSGSLADNTDSLAVLFVAAIVLSVALLRVPAGWLRDRDGWIWTTIGAFLEGWRQLRSDPRSLGLLFLLAIAKLLLVSARFWICFGALQLPVDYLGSIMFAVVASLLVIVSITPGAVGVRELLIGAIASVTGMSFAHGAAAASLDRVLSLLFVIAGGIPSLLHLRARKLL